jgi:hypothetical protein
LIPYVPHTYPPLSLKNKTSEWSLHLLATATFDTFLKNNDRDDTEAEREIELLSHTGPALAATAVSNAKERWNDRRHDLPAITTAPQEPAEACYPISSTTVAGNLTHSILQ